MLIGGEVRSIRWGYIQSGWGEGFSAWLLHTEFFFVCFPPIWMNPYSFMEGEVIQCCSD